MALLNNIMERAAHYLTTGWPTDSGRGGRGAPEVVYDHSQRVLHFAGTLRKEAEKVDTKIDETILTASAMFHDAGWVDLVRQGNLQVGQIFSRPADNIILERGALVACEMLSDLLSIRQLETVTEVITGLKMANPERIEARMISDAENLEEFGLIGVFREVRAAQAAGKSSRQILEGWNRRQEYHYWDARIRSAFHFETTRVIARERLTTMSHIYELLCREISPENTQEKKTVYTPPIAAVSEHRRKLIKH